MSNFEFVFSLFGLLLGLGLAEVLNGFGNAIQERRNVQIGWLTPLLGLLVALDLTSFWSFVWDVRETVPASYLALLVGLLIFGVYYLVARIVFPRDLAEWPDFDDYYFQHRRWVLGGVMLCNVAGSLASVALGAPLFPNGFSMVSLPLFFLLASAAMFARSWAANAALLSLLAAEYVLFPVIATISKAAS